MNKAYIETNQQEAVAILLGIPVEEVHLILRHFTKIAMAIEDGTGYQVSELINSADDLPVCSRAKLYFMHKVTGWLERHCTQKP